MLPRLDLADVVDRVGDTRVGIRLDAAVLNRCIGLVVGQTLPVCNRAAPDSSVAGVQRPSARAVVERLDRELRRLDVVVRRELEVELFVFEAAGEESRELGVVGNAPATAATQQTHNTIESLIFSLGKLKQ